MEEFTFPSIPLEQCNAKKLSFPHFASPPLWFVPGGDADAAAAHDHLRSFSAVEQAGKAGNDYPGGGHHSHGSERFAVEEDKMDMLWEDFNEELARAAPPCPLSKEWAREAWLAGDGAAAVEMRRYAVASGSVVRRRRLSLLMMLKLLKKLFLAHKSNATSRKAPPI